MQTNTTLTTRREIYSAMVLLAIGILSPISASNALAAETKSYPLKVCVVSGNELGSMGTPITRKYGDHEVKFCCKPCVKKFEKAPEKYLQKLKK